MPAKRKNKVKPKLFNKHKKLLWLLALVIISMVSYYIYLNVKSSLIKYKEFGVNVPDKYTVHGIDVSHYQGFINWKSVKKMNIEDIKIDFAFIKATQGVKTLDLHYHQNQFRARNAGIKVGSYHFFVVSKDPLVQAKFFYRNIVTKSGDLLPVIDIEKDFGVSDKNIRKNLKVCLDYLEQKIGKKPIIYTNPGFYHRYLQDEFEEYPLWVSHYNGKNDPDINRKWQIWQISERANINGIKGYVDLNVLKGDLDDLENLTIP
jgi:lysozyme